MSALTVMIVEDELLLAMDLEDILTDAGFTVIGNAVDMHGALELAGRFSDRLDVAIMDVNLARGTNGVETARHLRQRHDIPSLFVSANLDEKTRAMAAEWGPIGFVGKPFVAREVVRALGAMQSAA